jgi:hypothetical protein
MMTELEYQILYYVPHGIRTSRSEKNIYKLSKKYLMDQKRQQRTNRESIVPQHEIYLKNRSNKYPANYMALLFLFSQSCLNAVIWEYSRFEYFSGEKKSKFVLKLERETGLGPATSTLAMCRECEFNP